MANMMLLSYDLNGASDERAAKVVAILRGIDCAKLTDSTWAFDPRFGDLTKWVQESLLLSKDRFVLSLHRQSDPSAVNIELENDKKLYAQYRAK